MKMVFVFSLLLPLVVLFQQQVLAKTTVSVKSNTSEGDVSSNVNIRNNINTSVNGSSTSNTKTDIRIESNDEVKEYHFDKPEDFSMQSSDGNVKVDINNSGSATVNSTSNTTVNDSVNVSVNGKEVEVQDDEEEIENDKETGQKKEDYTNNDTKVRLENGSNLFALISSIFKKISVFYLFT